MLSNFHEVTLAETVRRIVDEKIEQLGWSDSDEYSKALESLGK